MGGLFNKIPLTSWTFGIGLLALIGCPLFSGYFSKDLILAYAFHQHPLFYWAGSFTAFLTAFYMCRLYIVAFFGKARVPAAEHPHESPKVMTVPLVILAVFSFIAGWSIAGYGIENFYHAWQVNLLHATGQVPETGQYIPVPELPEFYAFVPLALIVSGVLAAWYLYFGCASDPLDIRVLARKFYVDEFYDQRVVAGQQDAANLLSWLDNWVLDGVILRGAAYITVGVGEVLRLFQTGSLQTYAFLFSLGGALVIYFALFVH
jgi:NADH-quinone oxidoreductase subunit L